MQDELDALNEMPLMPTMAEDVATAEMALADAMERLHTEHIFVDVNVYDAMGMMMGSDRTVSG